MFFGEICLGKQNVMKMNFIIEIDLQSDIDFFCDFQTFGTHVLHLHAVGCLLRLLERWLVAEGSCTSDKSWWKPPESWNYGSQLQASHFELFLKQNWGMELLSLLDVHCKDIRWWKTINQVQVCVTSLTVTESSYFRMR